MTGEFFSLGPRDGQIVSLGPSEEPIVSLGPSDGPIVSLGLSDGTVVLTWSKCMKLNRVKCLDTLSCVKCHLLPSKAVNFQYCPINCAEILWNVPHAKQKVRKKNSIKRIIIIKRSIHRHFLDSDKKKCTTKKTVI